MLKVAARFPERIDAHKSVMPLLQVKEFWPEVSLGGAFFTFVGLFAPHAGEHVEQHFASGAGTVALFALLFEALVRFVIGMHEWWVQRRSERSR